MRSLVDESLDVFRYDWRDATIHGWKHCGARVVLSGRQILIFRVFFLVLNGCFLAPSVLSEHRILAMRRMAPLQTLRETREGEYVSANRRRRSQSLENVDDEMYNQCAQ
jgi:hypothetical protein